ncbi:MAG: hypothetical protein HYV03_05565 [Deltaproteobacteria bacterium]|nr:hypothetical protein [Deltaproteobacteria bacterium]
MSAIKQTRVGTTIGERRQAEMERTATIPQQDTQGFLQKVRDFFRVSVDPKVIESFAPNTRFLNGANIHPLKALEGKAAEAKPRYSDQQLFALLDQIAGPKKTAAK